MHDQLVFNKEFDVRTSFVALVDHLPAEIIRKLWLIQTLDTKHDTLKNELDHNLKEYQTQELPKEESDRLVSSITKTISKMQKARLESLTEAKSISSSIKLARLRLDNQHQQLQHDHKIYLNEIEMQNNLAKHAQRSNKRTSTSRPKIKLKLNPRSVPVVSSPVRPKVRKPSLQKVSAKRQSKTLSPARNPKNEKKISSAFIGRQRSEDEDQDTDHTLYCTCNRESFGDMVACDNPKCPKEWFHYACVGLVRAPRGRWFCPLCEKKK